MTNEQTTDTVTSGDHGPGGGADVVRRRGPRRGWIIGGLIAAVVVIAFVLWWFEPQALFIDEVVDEAFPTTTESAAAADRDDPATDPADADNDGAAPGGGADDGAADAGGDAAATGGDAADAGSAATGADQDATDADPADGDAADDEAAAATGPTALRAGTFSSRNRYEVTGTATAFALDDAERVLRLEDFASTNGPDLFVYLTSADASATDGEIDADFVDLGVLTGNIGNQNYVIPPEVDLDVYDTVVIWCRRFTSSFGVAALDPVTG
jgi:hypothetical protein